MRHLCHATLLLADVLSAEKFDLLCAAISKRDDGGCELAFALHVRNDNRERTPLPVHLKAVAGHADDGSPCITVMLSTED